MHPRRFFQTLYTDLRPDTERGRLVRSAGATVVLKIGGAVITFGASLVYARALQPHGYGLYAYVLAWAGLLTLPAGLGFPLYLVREGAKFPSSLRSLLAWADSRLLVSGLLFGIMLVCAFFLPQAADARWLFVVAAPLPLLNNMGDVRAALLHVLGWVARSQWPKFILGPGLTLAVLAGLWVWRGRLYPVELIASIVAAATLTVLINQFQFRRAVREFDSESMPSVNIKSALPFMWLGMLYMINSRTDLIMLGSIKGAHDAGIYAVAMRAGEVITFVLMAADMVLRARIARLYHDGDYHVLQRLLTAAVRRIALLSAPLAILFIVAANPLLHHLYGSAYADGATPLRILAGAQFLSVLFGSTDHILNMTGHERLTMRAVAVSVLLNIVLNFLLVPPLGIDGAAIATATSLIVWNFLLWFWVRNKLQLHPSVFGI